VEQLAADLLPAARGAVVAVFLLVALVAVVRARRGGPAGPWAAATFGSLGLALLLGEVEQAAGVVLPGWLTAVRIALILLFPYLLLRFTAVFHRFPRWLEVGVAALAAGVVVATAVLLPSSRESGPRPPGVAAYVTVVLAYWLLLSLMTIATLWRAGRGQPTVARRRMRLMSAATAVLALALLLAVELGDESPSVQLSVQLTALVSGAIFGLGYYPPRAVRLSWRLPEEKQLQRGTMAVLRATTAEQVASELLPPTVRVVGARGAALVDAQGRVVATYGDVPAPATDPDGAGSIGREGSRREVVPLGDGRDGELVVWMGPYAPFFAGEEIDLLRAMGAVAGMALERCELLADERSQRAATDQARHEADRAREEANRANTAKSEFWSRMSHELRTPLNAILGFGQLLELSSLDAEDSEGVGHILKAGRHLLALIDDVLDLSRIEAGMLTISLEPVETAELIGDAADLIRPLADSRSIRLTIDADGCDVYVMTDRQRCRQILLNLLSNAVKYNRDGGDVDVSCLRVTDGILRVAVRDSGPGIDPSRIDRLFEPLDRLGAESSGVEGTGLGLALTKQLVERLGGSIGVESAPGQGSTFWIDLPVTESPAGSRATRWHPETSTPAGDRTLLLVEDNLANLRLVEAMLRRRPGIALLPAMQGRLAIELAHEHQPDVIMLDLHLPDLSGREVLHRLRADPRTRDIPVVISSADATPARIRRLREEGAFDYVTKPLDVGRFLEVVDAALAHRDATPSPGHSQGLGAAG
jgi:signal transduction histidine kinase/CheY-like chemotaxis protein